MPDPLNLSNKVEVLRNSNLYGDENPHRRGKVRDVYDLGDRMLIVPPPHIPGPVVQEVSKRCVASYKVLSGSRTVDEFDPKNVDEVIKELST